MKRFRRNLLPAACALLGAALMPAASRAEEPASAAAPVVAADEPGSAADSPTEPPAPVEPGVPGVPDPELPGEPGGPDAADALEPAEPTNVLSVITDKLPSGKPAKFPIGMMVLVDNSVGAGAFMLNAYARQPYVATMVRIEPSLTIWKSLRARMRLDINKEWVASYSQGTTVPNQLMITDVWMGLTMGEIYREQYTGIGFGGGLWTFAPTSIQSRSETLVTAVRPFALVDWRKWGFNASYNFSIRKNFHQYAHPTVDAREGVYDCPTEGRGRCVVTSAGAGPRLRSDDPRNYQELGDGRVLDLSRRNTDFTLYHTAAIGYTAFDQLTFSASLIFVDSFKYYLPRDGALSSQWVTNEWGRTQSTWGVIDVTWSPFEHVSFSTGVSSLQPLWSQHRGAGLAGWDTNGRVFNDTSGGKLMPNFPFFDALTPANNYTAYYFDVAFSI